MFPGIITFPVILCSLRLLSNKSIPLVVCACLCILSCSWFILCAFLASSRFSFSNFCFSLFSCSNCSILFCSCNFIFFFLSSSDSSAYVTNSWYFGHSASRTALTFIGKHFIMIFNCLSVYCEAMLLKLSTYLSSFLPNLL